MTNQIASVSFIDGVVVEPDFLYIATQLDSLDPEEEAHTRMSVYRPSVQEKPFGHHDFKANIVSVHAYRALPVDQHRYVALDRHGKVCFRKGGAEAAERSEQLPGAGLLGANLGGLMAHLREIGGHLWACGQRGQVYRRYAQDDWRHMDEGLHKPLRAEDFRSDPGALAAAMVEGPMLNCIDGNNEQDIYAVGDQGLLVHFDGRVWTRLALRTDEHLQWVRCYGASETWVCGYNGTLLRGNARDGFKELSAVDDNQTWVCLTKFRDLVYLSAEEGLHVFDGKSIKPVKTRLVPELQDAWRVDHADGVLWSIGVKDLGRFDGKRWVRIDDPDNPPIR